MSKEKAKYIGVLHMSDTELPFNIEIFYKRRNNFFVQFKYPCSYGPRIAFTYAEFLFLANALNESELYSKYKSNYLSRYIHVCLKDIFSKKTKQLRGTLFRIAIREPGSRAIVFYIEKDYIVKLNLAKRQVEEILIKKDKKLYEKILKEL